ncbi:hypothetical protein E2C01_036006 [Portunus trituberculatus]|uniref:Uncharacterized protein n=1 Tax=Portunus trituberculatus TaxID=210409 RepID=A0A5B7F9X3_PORTR|nr:hypothetical protein [Portunus trituberculatus]
MKNKAAIEKIIGGKTYQTEKEMCEIMNESFKMLLEQQKKFGRGGGVGVGAASSGSGSRSLGIRKGVSSKFASPMRREDEYGSDEIMRRCLLQGSSRSSAAENSPYSDLLTDPRLAQWDSRDLADKHNPVEATRGDTDQCIARGEQAT